MSSCGQSGDCIHKQLVRPICAMMVCLSACNPGFENTTLDAQISDADSIETLVDGPAQEFDLGRDFSFARNPNGPWSYGFTRQAILDFRQIELFTHAENSSPTGIWHPRAGAEPTNYYPYAGSNRGEVASTEPTGGWAARPNDVAMEASNSGQFSVVSFRVPTTGRYEIVAAFEGIHFNLSTTDVHIRHSDIALFDDQVMGYGGDPSFHAIEGSHPRAEYRGVVSLQAEELVLFAVGYGSNQNHFNDTTALRVHIRKL